MRKPRDYDSELKALAENAKAIKERRVRQLGELVAATGADALDADLLAGVLLNAVANKDGATKEGWRKAGAPFFQGKARQPAPRLTNSRKALYRSKAARYRIEAAKARVRGGNGSEGKRCPPIPIRLGNGWFQHRCGLRVRAIARFPFAGYQTFVRPAERAGKANLGLRCQSLGVQ